MIPEEYLELVEKLTLLTDKHKIRWEETSDASKFKFKGSNVSITIEMGYDFLGNKNFFKFDLLNLLGDQLDSFCIYEKDKDNDTMSFLYNKARRSALKIEESINSLLGDLNKLEE